MNHDVTAARRNAAVLGATALSLGLLLLYPTSTNRTGHRRPGQALAPAGVVQAATPAAGTRARVVTVNGASVDTQYGPVQVQLRVRAGRVVAATAIDYPQDRGQSRQISKTALPVLAGEAVAAQSARIDTVSGATYTSDGYRRSLQAALDAAHLR